MTQAISNAFSIASAYLPLQQGAKQAKEEAAQAKLVDEIFKAIPLFCIPTLAGMIAGYVADPFSIKDSKELLSIFSPRMIENWLANRDEKSDVTLDPKEVADFIEATKIIQSRLPEKITSRHLSQFYMRKCAPNSEGYSQYQVALKQHFSCFSFQNLKVLYIELEDGQTLESHLELFRVVPIEDLTLVSPDATSLSEVANHKSLVTLTLRYTKLLHAVDLSPLLACSKLKTLAIFEKEPRETPSPSFDFSFLPKHSSLHDLTLFLSFPSEQTVLPKDCFALQTLTMGQSVTDANIMTLSLPSLTQLKLKKCAHITDAAITALKRNCPKLASLELKNCSNLSAEMIASLRDNPKFTVYPLL